MFCLKCGKDTAGENVFCDECLEIMEKYPVKPGTAVYIPPRKKVVEEKNKKRIHWRLSSADQLDELRKVIRLMAILLILTTAALGAVTFLLLYGGLFGM